MLKATLAAARNTVMTNAGLPGSGGAMGDAASVFESLCQRQRDFFPVSSWPATLEGRRALVASTRKTLGMDWRGRVTCPTDDHALREVCPLQSAAMRDPTVFTIPHGQPRTLKDALADCFLGGSSIDFTNPSNIACPACQVLGPHTTWQYLPWTDGNAPDRLFFASARLDWDLAVGAPPTPSPTLNCGAAYTLVAVVYHVAVYGGRDAVEGEVIDDYIVRNNHYVTQMLLRGKWVLYDCMLGGKTFPCPTFQHGWHPGKESMYVYLKDELVAPDPSVGTPYRSMAAIRADSADSGHHDSVSRASGAPIACGGAIDDFVPFRNSGSRSQR